MSISLGQIQRSNVNVDELTFMVISRLDSDDIWRIAGHINMVTMYNQDSLSCVSFMFIIDRKERFLRVTFDNIL